MIPESEASNVHTSIIQTRSFAATNSSRDRTETKKKRNFLQKGSGGKASSHRKRK